MVPVGRVRSPHSVVSIDGLIEHVSTIAADQRGLIRTDQVEESDRASFRYLVRRGVTVRVAKGVYRITGAPITWHQSLQAGVWSLGPSSMVSHAAAARLHGFDGFDAAGCEFVVDRACRGRSPAGVECTVHTAVHHRAADRVHIDGLPATSAARTIVDLARNGAGRAALESSVDSAVRLRKVTLEVLIDRLRLLRGPELSGFGRLAGVLVHAGGHTFLERRFLELVDAAGFPTPTPQVVHRVGGRHIARVDFEFVRHGVVVEVSGGRGHSSAADRAKDARRRNDLQRDGLLVLEFTYEQVVDESDMVIAVLRAALAERATHSLAPGSSTTR